MTMDKYTKEAQTQLRKAQDTLTGNHGSNLVNQNHGKRDQAIEGATSGRLKTFSSALKQINTLIAKASRDLGQKKYATGQINIDLALKDINFLLKHAATVGASSGNRKKFGTKTSGKLQTIQKELKSAKKSIAKQPQANTAQRKAALRKKTNNQQSNMTSFRLGRED